jgi:hypothetical protein
VTGKRRPKKARPGEAQRISQPELRIIDQETWTATQRRIAEVSVRQDQSKAKAPLRKTSYPLSGLLYCSCCGAPMVIAGGTGHRIYKCGDFHKRRHCHVAQGLREEQISDAVVKLLQSRLRSPQAIAFLADQLQKKAVESESSAGHQYQVTRKALADTQNRLGRLVENLASGRLGQLALGPVNQALEKEEASRLALEAKLVSLDAQRQATKAVPSKKELTFRAKGIVGDLRNQLRRDPIKAREQIRQFLVDGKITMEAKEDGSWAAHFKYFPTLLLKAPQNGNNPGRKSEVVYSSGCAGAIRGRYHGPEVVLEVRVA